MGTAASSATSTPDWGRRNQQLDGFGVELTNTIEAKVDVSKFVIADGDNKHLSMDVIRWIVSLLVRRAVVDNQLPAPTFPGGPHFTGAAVSGTNRGGKCELRVIITGGEAAFDALGLTPDVAADTWKHVVANACDAAAQTRRLLAKQSDAQRARAEALTVSIDASALPHFDS